jgi:serine/threonine protein kinase/cephalosporin-C deacetylase-like acetyl esterase
MKCPKCQAEILDDSQFCSKCGTPIHPGDKAFLSHTQTILRPIDELVPGTELAGKYKIIDVVGKGGMGIVYKAEDIKLKRKVALKFLPPELTKNNEAKERFVLEAQAAAALSHPNICTIHEIDEDEGKSFIAMEYVEGESLKNKIDKGPIAIEEVMDIAIQVAQGMEQAHKKGIIHRDIKSANIMATDLGQAKILDFGLVKVKGGTLLTREGTTLGTVAYMSPEQARGEEVDQRTDIWSLGIVLYEMLSGQLPFMGDREASILYSVVHEEAKPVAAWNPDIPTELQQIIDRALKKKPESRYQSAADLLKDLQKYEDSLRAEKLGAFSVRSFLRLIRKPVVAIPALIIIAAIAITAILYFNRQAKIRWAKNIAIPEIQRLEADRQQNWTVDNLDDKYAAIFSLAKKVEKYIPQDPQLAVLWPQFSWEYVIESEPSGALVYFKPYAHPMKDWEYAGSTPISKIRLPISFYRWKFEKEGYETAEAVSLGVPKLSRILDKMGKVPENMVKIPGRKTSEEIGTMADFFIDKYEVNNRQFKEFIEAGGYTNREYWKHPFVKDNRELSWDKAVSEFVDSTGRPGPSTWQAGDYPAGQADYPVSGVSWYEAAAYAEFVGKRLPTVIHWYMALGTDLPNFNFYFPSFIIRLCNFNSTGPEAVGKNQGVSVFGVYDMGGNVREWCWNESDMGRYIRGGAWNDITYQFLNRSHAPAFERSPKNGFRCIKESDESKILKAAYEPVPIESMRDFTKEKPVSDQIFEVYRSQFDYDKKELEAEVESRDDSLDDRVVEKVTFAAAYGSERVIAFLFLPKKEVQPFQTVIFFPGSPSSIWTNTSKDLVGLSGIDFFVKSGRAVVYPIYKGTYERNTDGCNNAVHMPTEEHQHIYTDYLIKWTKDFKRTIDYLETRPDIDATKIAYYGWSWGGRLGAVIPAIETRLKASILYLGGMGNESYQRPEADEFNYVSRVKVPTLMLNGKYDMVFPYETTVKPMYDYMGTPEEHKVLKLYDTDHYIPYNELIKESLAWLDKYLGPVK